MKEIITQSSCLHARNPAESISGTADYNRIIVRDIKTREERVIFVGEEWDKENFIKKCGNRRSPTL